MSTLHYTISPARSSARVERLVLALGLFLPVPALSATGLSVPLPAVVERLAAALVPWAEAAVLSEQPVERGTSGSIVLTRSERATPSTDARLTSIGVPAAAPADSPGAVVVAPPSKSARPKAHPAAGKRRTGTRRGQPSPATAAVRPSTPSGPAGDTTKRDRAPKHEDKPSQEPTVAVTTERPEPKQRKTHDHAAPTPAPTAPVEQPTTTVISPGLEAVDQAVETTYGTVEEEADAAKEKTGEKVDHVVVTVDKTGEKAVGPGKNVVRDVDVTVQKLPKLPGG